MKTNIRVVQTHLVGHHVLTGIKAVLVVPQRKALKAPRGLGATVGHGIALRAKNLTNTVVVVIHDIALRATVTTVMTTVEHLAVNQDIALRATVALERIVNVATVGHATVRLAVASQSDAPGAANETTRIHTRNAIRVAPSAALRARKSAVVNIVHMNTALRALAKVTRVATTNVLNVKGTTYLRVAQIARITRRCYNE